MKKQFIIFFSLVILYSLITSYSHAEKIKVIASIAPLADFAKQVGGERVDVKLLLPSGASPHTYEPTPKAMKDISDAKVFLKIGAGFEFWAEKIVKASGNKKLIVVETSSGISLIRDEHVHKRVPGDPHIWLDPLIATKIVNQIEKEFMKVDPSGATYYEANAVSYKKELTKLDKEITERVMQFRAKEYVTFHPAWNYFSRRYGLEVVGVIEESPGREPSPKHIAGIIREIKRIGSKVIFVEPQFNPKIAEVIAKESGAQVLSLDPLGGQKGRETYIDMMRYNISVMERAMK